MAEVIPSIARPGVLELAARAAVRIGASVSLDGFRLAGGTALAWHLGHRVSEDLDFFTFEPRLMDAAGADRLVAHLRLADPSGAVANPSDQTIHAVVEGCKVSFFGLTANWIEPPVVVQEGLELASVLDVTAMKLVAVMTRCAKKNFYDLVAIAESGISGGQMYAAGLRMYPGFAAARPHLLRALQYFDEAEADPDPISLVGAKWPQVKQRMRQLARTV